MKKEDVKTLFESRYIKVYDLQYQQGAHYFNASRRNIEDLPAIKTKEELQHMIADAVSCVVIVEYQGEEKLLLSYEYRYPSGQFLLSVPAGIIDEEDKHTDTPLINTAIREIKEETGLTVKDTDFVKVLNPALFSTPGMSDETNAIVLAKIKTDTLDDLNQEGAVGSEQFDGFELLSKDDAKKILEEGRDKNGIYYSVYTWIALATFVGNLY